MRRIGTVSEDAPYIISFSSYGLNLHEFLIATNVYLSSNAWGLVQILVIQRTHLQSHMIRPIKRLTNRKGPCLLKKHNLSQLLKKRDVHLGLLETNWG